MLGGVNKAQREIDPCSLYIGLARRCWHSSQQTSAVAALARSLPRTEEVGLWPSAWRGANALLVQNIDSI